MKILIAEDDPTFQLMLGALIVKWGHEPVISGNGREAWELLQSSDAPRLALLDWVMPGLNGIDVCRNIRSQASNSYIYVILLTGKTKQEDAIAALEAGADDIITKPFHPHELRARINTAVRILALEENLSKRAFYDELTGLPNRVLLAERFKTVTALASQTAAMTAVLYIDLDHFKAINDNFGHAAGDAVLREVAASLKPFVGESETLARIGGDEFVFFTNVKTTDAAARIAEQIRTTLESLHTQGRIRLPINASIGISFFPRDAEVFEFLLRNADAAMYAAKSQRQREGVQIFNADIGSQSQARLLLETRLPGALVRDELLVHYQPILRLNDLTVVASEALVRWNDPDRGMMAPGDFIPLAEETGHIAEIGKWVLDRACKQAKQWTKDGDAPFRVCVNMSARQFADDDVVDTVSETLARTGLPPRALELEMTETAIASNLVKSAATIGALRALGVRIALDDFGTGYSSLSYLANLPIDTLKIDRSFLSGIRSNQRSEAVLKSVVNLAHELGTIVVAEGVEQLDQLKIARDAGCDEVQGFLFGKPGGPEDIRVRKSFVVLDQTRISTDLHTISAQLAPAVSNK